jgi:hypothetical protein
MPSDVIPLDIRKFILQNIDSVAQLEGLLLLRVNAEKSYNTETIAKRLYINQDEAAELLHQLMERGFLSADGKNPTLYQYAPQNPELEPMVKQVVELYARYLVPVTHLIHSKPKSKIQKFADAFWIRKE